MRISLLIKTIQPDEIECGKEMVFRPKALEKADFTDKMTGPAIGVSGAAGQFLQTESAQKGRLNLWILWPT